MIKYNLKCHNYHEFESWFSNSKEFDKFIKPEELEKYLSDEKFSTLDIKGLKFNPFLKKWKKTNDLSVNYIINSLKN